MPLKRLAGAFLGGAPPTPAALSLAKAAARAQHMLDLIRLSRLRLLDETEASAATYTGPGRPSDRRVIMTALERAAAGCSDIGGGALREMWSRLRREAPRDSTLRHIEVFQTITAELERLEQYELRATGRRRQAIHALDAWRAGVTSQAG